MSSHEALIGKLAMDGYMVTWHEGEAHVHWGDGKRWASIDLSRNIITHGVDTYREVNIDGVLSRLEQLAG